MIKKDLYRYTGRNGIITSVVYLEGIKFYPMYRLLADKDKILTDGEREVSSIDIFVEDLEKWTEIDKEGQI